MATSWTTAERTQFEARVREASGDPGPITWVALDPGDRLESVLRRRGGVDLLLGISASALNRIGPPRGTNPTASGDGTNPKGRFDGTKPKATGDGTNPKGRFDGTNPIDGESLRVLRRPGDSGRGSGGEADPRDDPKRLALLKARLGRDGWAEGYAGLVQDSARAGPGDRAEPPAQVEVAARVVGGPNPGRASRFLERLEAAGLAGPIPPGVVAKAEADGLLADLLGAALVDALDELREADASLFRFGHPARATAAFGERPPWPPASVTRLRAGPEGEALVSALLGQVAPEAEARAWLAASWSGPKRPVDAALLDELAGAVDGRLGREPRFRAWLRGEWAAWDRQLFRRVARLAGGYNPP